VHVAGSQGAPLDIAELVEDEQRVVTGAAEMAVVGAALLLAIGWALARIQVEHDDPRRSSLVYLVDPAARVNWAKQPARITDAGRRKKP